MNDSIRLAVLTGIATALTPCLAAAQDADQPAEAPASGMQEVIVTATATSVKKLDASYSVVTADLETIRQEGGWKSLRMVERYAAVSAAHRAEAMAKLK